LSVIDRPSVSEWINVVENAPHVKIFYKIARVTSEGEGDRGQRSTPLPVWRARNRDKRDNERGGPRSPNRYEILKDYCRDGGVYTDADGVEDNGTARDELVDAEIEGAVRFGGLGEFFAPWDSP